jgi:hypothetical protein
MGKENIMEQAVFIAKVDHLKYCDENFTRLYFGNEFCERLIPSKEQLEKVLDCTEKRDLAFTMVTPYVTNKGLKKLEAVISFVAAKKPQSELVFNDWGVLQFVKQERLPVTPVLGRLLTKMKRGPRLMNILNRVPETTGSYFQKSNLNVPDVTNFLKDHGIFRVELDNLLQGIDLDGTDKEIRKSLYLPFAFVTTTRFCLSANGADSEKKTYIGVFPCKKECQTQTFHLDNPVMRLPLLRKGNTIFFTNDTIADVIKKKQVDRIVIEPEIPI